MSTYLDKSLVELLKNLVLGHKVSIGIEHALHSLLAAVLDRPIFKLKKANQTSNPFFVGSNYLYHLGLSELQESHDAALVLQVL